MFSLEEIAYFKEWFCKYIAEMLRVEILTFWRSNTEGKPLVSDYITRKHEKLLIKKVFILTRFRSHSSNRNPWRPLQDAGIFSDHKVHQDQLAHNWASWNKFHQKSYLVESSQPLTSSHLAFLYLLRNSCSMLRPREATHSANRWRSTASPTIACFVSSPWLVTAAFRAFRRFSSLDF